MLMGRLTYYLALKFALAAIVSIENFFPFLGVNRWLSNIFNIMLHEALREGW